MINGYAASASVWPGQRLILHVSTDAARFRVGFYRWEGKLVSVLTSGWVDGEHAPARGADQDWQWPAYAFTLPAGWAGGVYIAHLEEPGNAAPHITMPSAAILFIVRGYGHSKLLYKIALATFNAYNFSGQACYYASPPRSLDPPGAKLSFRRPGGAIGGETFGAADHYDSSSPRQTFAHWDARFIAWLTRHGYTPEFCTDLDIHNDPALLDNYQLLMSVGHDEYWSEPMRDGVERYITRGGNAAFFSANVCWWRIHIVDDGSAMVCHQGGAQGARDHWWPTHGAARPEDALAGVSYRHGGGWWDGPRSSAGFAVQQPEHWVFAGTALRQGQRFGASTCPPLIGYECDGAPLGAFDHASGKAALAPLARLCGTPAGFQLLAACPLDDQWQERPVRETVAGTIHAATMGLFTRGGSVFTAGTTDWAQVLGSGQDERVDRITANVIDGLLNGATASHGARNAPHASAGVHGVVAATASGQPNN